MENTMNSSRIQPVHHQVPGLFIMKEQEEPDMAAEYDFSGGIRGKYLESYRLGTNLVLLDPDVTDTTPDMDEEAGPPPD